MEPTSEEMAFQLFRTLDSFEDCFDYMDECFPSFGPEVDKFRIEMERVADRMFAIAADQGWRIAFIMSGFQAFRYDLNDLTERAGRMLRG